MNCHLPALTTEEQRSRVRYLLAAATVVMGERDARLWHTVKFEDFHNGGSPHDAAYLSDEGLAEALEYLNRRAPALRDYGWTGGPSIWKPNKCKLRWS